MSILLTLYTKQVLASAAHFCKLGMFVNFVTAILNGLMSFVNKPPYAKHQSKDNGMKQTNKKLIHPKAAKWIGYKSKLFNAIQIPNNSSQEKQQNQAKTNKLTNKTPQRKQKLAHKRLKGLVRTCRTHGTLLKPPEFPRPHAPLGAFHEGHLRGPKSPILPKESVDFIKGCPVAFTIAVVQLWIAYIYIVILILLLILIIIIILIIPFDPTLLATSVTHGFFIFQLCHYPIISKPHAETLHFKDRCKSSQN